MNRIETTAIAGAALIAAGVIASAATAQTGKVEFTAFAVNMSAPAGAAASTVIIGIDRWSTDAERDRALAAFAKSETQAQLDALQKLPRVGYIRTPDSIGYELHYARQEQDADGGRRIFIATDRPITAWEAANRPRTIDYPFTFIEMHLGHGKPGEGKLSIATKVKADRERNRLELEDYALQPVFLTNVEERKR